MQVPKLHIYYQHYNAHRYEKDSRDPSKKRPDWFSYELCLKNILDTTVVQRSDGRVKFTIWYDGDDDDFKNDPVLQHIAGLKSVASVNVIKGKWGSNTASGTAMINFLNSGTNDIQNEEYIYILENDYLHKIDWYEGFAQLVKSSIKFDYIAMYDHRDNYDLAFHQKFNQKLFYTENYLWKTTFSTCGSRIVKYKTLKEDAQILVLPDFYSFLHLNLKNRDLICATPGLSTHAMQGLESPGINWKVVADYVSTNSFDL